MSIFTDAWGVLKGAGSSVADLATRVYHTISATAHFILHLSDLVGGAWDWMIRGADAIGADLIGWADQAYHTVRWLAVQALPAAARWALNKAVGWAKAAVLGAEHLAHAALVKAERWTVGLVGDLRRWATGKVRSIERTLSGIYRWIVGAARKAVDLVLHPERLVAWILPVLVLPLVKWLVRSSAPIVIFLAKSAATVMPELAHTIEDALAKIV